MPKLRVASDPLVAAGGEPALPPRHEAGTLSVAVVIPCFRAATTVREVLARIGPSVNRIYVVDDACPDRSGEVAAAEPADPRLSVLRNDANLGVGGAMKRGYCSALDDGADIVVKIDADGQMDPALIDRLIAPIVAGRADFTKGNRFARLHRMPPGSDPRAVRSMPPVRRMGNNLLSFLHKAVTGYWNILDPANGYIAIHRRALESIDLDSVADCYFFETDMLFQLNLVDAVVEDVALPARYSGEVSSLRVRQVISRFPRLAVNRFLKRIWIKYFVQEFNVASLEILLGLPLLIFGSVLGLYKWMAALESGVANSAGTVMLAALPIIIGFQLLLSAVSYDVFHRPREPISRPPES